MNNRQIAAMRKLAAPNSFGNYAVDAKLAPPYKASPTPMDLSLRTDPYWRGRTNLTPTQQAFYRQPNFAHMPFDAYTQYQEGRKIAQDALKPDPSAAVAARYMNFSGGYAHHPATQSPYRTAEQIAEARSTGQSRFLSQAGAAIPLLSAPPRSGYSNTIPSYLIGGPNAPRYVDVIGDAIDTANVRINPRYQGPLFNAFAYKTSFNGQTPTEALRDNKTGYYGTPTPIFIHEADPGLNAQTARATLRSAGYNDYLDERAGEAAAQGPGVAYRLYRDKRMNNAAAVVRNWLGFDLPYNSLTEAAVNPDMYGVNLLNRGESPSEFYIDSMPRTTIPDPMNYARQNEYNKPYRYALYNTMER